ncbi:MAG: OmpH family outer membrane protein [Planctomycetota bacterium]
MNSKSTTGWLVTVFVVGAVGGAYFARSDASLSVALAAVAADGSLDEPTAPKPGAVIRIAYCDFETVFKNSAAFTRFQTELDEYVKREGVTLKQLEQELNADQEKLSLLKRGSDGFKELERSIIERRASLEYKDKEAKESIEQRWLSFREQHFQTIGGVVRGFAETNGYDLVLQKQLPRVGGETTWELVVYARPEFDITTQVLTIVNKDSK